MKSSHSRLLVLAAVSACVALFAAIPAFAAGTTVKVSIPAANQFSFKLSSSAANHGTVTFKVTNSGSLPHDFKVCASNKGGTATACTGKVTPMIQGGKSATLVVNLTKPGKYEYLCTVPGHAAAGMKGILTVK